MKIFKMTLAALAVALLACSCGKSKVGGFDTPEQLAQEYRKCHENGGEGIIALVYKNEQMPDEIRKMLEASIAEDKDQKIENITVGDYDDSNDAMMAEALKERGLKMPAKPTNVLKVAYADNGPVTDQSTEMPIAQIDGGYYLLAPIKAE